MSQYNYLYEDAPSGKVYQCGACGKRSRNQIGFARDKRRVSDYGWDESCFLNCALVDDVDKWMWPTAAPKEER